MFHEEYLLYYKIRSPIFEPFGNDVDHSYQDMAALTFLHCPIGENGEN